MHPAPFYVSSSDGFTIEAGNQNAFEVSTAADLYAKDNPNQKWRAAIVNHASRGNDNGTTLITIDGYKIHFPYAVYGDAGEGVKQTVDLLVRFGFASKEHLEESLYTNVTRRTMVFIHPHYVR